MNKTKLFLLTLTLALGTLFAVDFLGAQTATRGVKFFSEILSAPGARIVPSLRDAANSDALAVYDRGGTNGIRIISTNAAVNLGIGAQILVASNGVWYPGVSGSIGGSNYTPAGASAAFKNFVFRNGILISIQ